MQGQLLETARTFTSQLSQSGMSVSRCIFSIHAESSQSADALDPLAESRGHNGPEMAEVAFSSSIRATWKDVHAWMASHFWTPGRHEHYDRRIQTKLGVLTALAWKRNGSACEAKGSSVNALC
jgi:hypothetical protein